MSGAQSEAWGRSAEAQTARWYQARGGRVLAERARTEGGELDLVVAMGDVIVFVEVKGRRTIEAALAAVTPKKTRRLMQAAACFAAEKGASDAEMRFDVAALDRSGHLQVVENALWADGWA